MKKWLWWIVGIGTAIVIGVFLWWLYWYQAEWAGFYAPQNSPYESWKTLWDWLDLLIVPLVLANGGFLLNRAQRQSEQDNERITIRKGFTEFWRRFRSA